MFKRHVECIFFIKIIYPKDEGQGIEVYTNLSHNGYDSRLKNNSYFLPIHQSVINNCTQILNKLNNIKFVLKYFKRCKDTLR